MLFIISLSLLVGVVKVRAWLGRGRGVGTWGVGMESSLPSCPLLFTPTTWAALDAERWEAGIWRRSNLHPEIFTLSFRKPSPFFHARPLGLEAPVSYENMSSTGEGVLSQLWPLLITDTLAELAAEPHPFELQVVAGNLVERKGRGILRLRWRGGKQWIL